MYSLPSGLPSKSIFLKSETGLRADASVPMVFVLLSRSVGIIGTSPYCLETASNKINSGWLSQRFLMITVFVAPISIDRHSFAAIVCFISG